MFKYITVLVIIFSYLLIILFIFLSVKKLFISLKSTPYECGFSSDVTDIKFFSNRFFLVALIFVVFDVEVALLFPLINRVVLIDPIFLLFICYFLIGFLTITLYVEWRGENLSWL